MIDENAIKNAVSNVYHQSIAPYESWIEFEPYERFYKKTYNPRLFAKVHCVMIEGLKDLFAARQCGGVVLYVHAQPSRNLIDAIDSLFKLREVLEETRFAFDVSSAYAGLFDEIRPQLNYTNGSSVNNTSMIESFLVPYETPLIVLKSKLCIVRKDVEFFSDMSLIGSGSFANVYKFHDSFLDRDFAVKRLRPQSNEKEIERFKQEFRILKRLNSPYIVDVYKFDLENNSFTMELMEGSVEQLCQDTSIGFFKRRSIVNQICRAVKYLHSNNICHRDIAPSNFLYRKYDDGCIVVKLSDFGISKDLENQLTSSDSAVKGRVVDPELSRIGFGSFKPIHDLYPLAHLTVFVMTGKMSGYEAFSELGEMESKAMRHEFKDVDSLVEYFNNIVCRDERWKE